jgi:hypothetical protein
MASIYIVSDLLRSILGGIVEREYLGWCESLMNKDLPGVLETASKIDVCLEVAEELGLEVERPLGWGRQA